MRYVAFLLLIFPLLASAKSSDIGREPAVCSDVMDQVRLAATFVGPSNYVVQFDRNKETHLILFLQRPSSNADGLRWRLIERQEESATYCVAGQGEGLKLLKDLHLSNPSGKYGMPGSGYARCASKQPAGLPGSLDIRLWANKELGNSIIYDLPNKRGRKDFIAMFAADGTGAWIVLAIDHDNSEDSCYYARGETSKAFQDFKVK
jgi:hypothetical protein